MAPAHGTIGRMNSAGERGAIAVWTAVAIPGFILALGIGVDFAGHTSASQEARAVASEAARAGGQQMMMGGHRAVLDVARARTTSRDYVRASQWDADVVADGDTVTVTVTGRYECQFLSVIGIDDLPVSATASSDSVSVVGGVER